MERNAQLNNAAPVRSSTNLVPIIQRPRPGGVHFKLNNRSYASFAVCCALLSFHSSPSRTTCCFWILNIPSITRRHVCHHSSDPVALESNSLNLRAYVLLNVIYPRGPQGTSAAVYGSMKESDNLNLRMFSIVFILLFL